MSRKKTDISSSADIPSAIKLLRKKAGLTQTHLGFILDRSLATIQRYECSQTIPDVGTLLVLMALAAYKDISTETANVFRDCIAKELDHRLLWAEKFASLHRDK